LICIFLYWLDVLTVGAYTCSYMCNRMMTGDFQLIID